MRYRFHWPAKAAVVALVVPSSVHQHEFMSHTLLCSPPMRRGADVEVCFMRAVLNHHFYRSHGDLLDSARFSWTG